MMDLLLMDGNLEEGGGTDGQVGDEQSCHGIEYKERSANVQLIRKRSLDIPIAFFLLL
jgi:hypothetical protein